MLPSPFPRLPIIFSHRQLLAQLIVHHGLRIIGLANAERTLLATLSKMEVPIRAAFRQFSVLSPVSTPFKLEDAVSVVAALHHGAHRFVAYLVPPAEYGLLQLV